MGFWNSGVPTSRSRSRSRSPSRHSHYSSRPAYARSSSSFFSGLGGGGHSSSRGHSSRARSRSGFINKIRRFLREIYEKLKRHPFRTFMLVIMPLLSSGILITLLSKVGIRLPPSIQRMMGGNQMRETSRVFARGGARDFGGGSALPGMSGAGLGDSLGTVMGIAKAFL